MRVKTLEELRETNTLQETHENEFRVISGPTEGSFFVESMKKYCGLECQITRFHNLNTNYFKIDVDNECWWWTKEYLIEEDVPEYDIEDLI